MRARLLQRSNPICHAPAEKFNKVEETAITWADEHKVGVAEGLDEEVVAGLRENFNGECSEVGMYLAMARVAYREGYPEVGMYYEKAAYEEAEHAAKFAELLGEVVTPSTKKNLEMRYMAENGACEGKLKLAKRAKELGSTLSMTPFTKWLRTKQDMDAASRVCLTDISLTSNLS